MLVARSIRILSVSTLLSAAPTFTDPYWRRGASLQAFAAAFSSMTSAITSSATFLGTGS